ncbi:MAG: hypothetical protein HYX86_05750, partial [Chloroflexi bacterium]|nr:hypothetical protein [Chloroflexota bacterium]
PPTLLLFRRFADGGYILAKTLGWLLVGYLVWITASLHLAMHILPTYLLAILGVALFSGYVWYKRGGEIRALISSKRKIILLSEALFAAAFLGFVGIRLLNPDLWQPWTGGEKSMEFAFLNAITKSPYFPPYDPYFAHGYINYYYYGLYLVAGLVKLTGIMPSMAFNLAIPALFAITVVNIFSLGYNLTRRVWVGIAAFGFVALLGNLDGAAQLWEGLRNLIQGSGSFPAFDYWRSSRVIPFTINEFPFWSFLFADLHPHMIGLPFTIFFLSVALSLAQGPGEENAPKEGLPLQSRVADWRGFLTFDQLGLGLVLTLSLGAVAVINLWDLPTYFLLLLGVFMLSVWSKGGTGNWRDALLTFAGVAILSLVLYWPFYANYAPLHAGLGLVNTRTDVGHFLTIWGFLIFVVASYLIIESSTRLAALASSRREVRLAILATVVVMAILFSLGEWLWGLLVPLVIIAGYLFWQRQGSVATSFAHLLIFMGLAILLGTEIFFLRDFLQGGEYQRMNTVFKFYMQAWVLLGIGGAAILPRLFAQIRSLRSTVVSTAWQGAFIVLLLGSSTFLFLGTKARVEDRFPGEKPAVGTLDGLAYMTVGRYFWPDQDHAIDLSYDYQAIQWLLANVQGTPVVAEAALPYYREGGLRVASYTGLPTLLGMHQNEQRYDWQVGQRDGEARAFFETADPNLALELIHRLHIQYIYVGQLERIVYPEYGLAKFESLRAQGWLELVYENPQVLLYRVVQAALADD